MSNPPRLNQYKPSLPLSLRVTLSHSHPMMWYLCRTPHSALNTQSNDFSNFTLRNSIFPVSDTGIFEEISIVEVQNKPLIIRSTDHTNDPNGNKRSQIYASTNWEWFAYLYSPTQFHSVAVPRNPSVKIQLISVLPERFLCAKLAPAGPRPHAILCTYSRISCTSQDVPKMHCEDRNPIGAAGALLDGWLYLAGGYKGNPSYVEPSTYLNSAERLNLKTWEWQALPPMKKARAFSTGLAHRGRFFVVGGRTLQHSAEIYNPTSNSWLLLKSFVPKEAKGFAVASVHGRLVLLTWSDRLGVKLWIWTELVNPIVIGGWRLISFFPNHEFERVRLRKHGARMVQVGKEVWVMVGENECVCQVDGSCIWPVFPAPVFRPSDGHEVVHKGHIYAFSFRDGGRLSWRQIPVYSI